MQTRISPHSPVKPERIKDSQFQWNEPANDEPDFIEVSIHKGKLEAQKISREKGQCETGRVNEQLNVESGISDLQWHRFLP